MTFDAIPAAPSFPATALGRTAELLANGTWTDITSYLDHAMIAIGRGHPDESVTTTASTLAMTLTNTAGAFTSTNPASPFYPYLIRNIPCRVSIPEGASYMRSEEDQASGAQGPGTGGVSITGDMDLQADMTPDNGWLSAMWLASKWASAGNERSWAFAVTAGGFLVFSWTTDGTMATREQAVSTVPVPVPAGRRMCARVTFAASTGTVTFWTAPAGLTGASWTQLGAAHAAGASSLYASTAPVQAGIAYGAGADLPQLGASGYQGKYHALLIASGIGGTVKASPDFTAQAPGTTSFADAQGGTWTLYGTAEISDRDYHGHFEMSSWTQNQDPTGKAVTTAAAGGGLLRRIGQAATPLASPMRRAYTQLSGFAAPVAYVPMEDAAGATQLGSGIGGPPMRFSGSPQLASSDDFGCSLALPVVNGAVMTMSVPSYPAGTACVLRFLLEEAAGSIPNGAVIARMFTNGTIDQADLVYYTGGALGLNGYSAGSYLQLISSGPIGFGIDGGLWLIEVDLYQDGADIGWSINAISTVAGQVGYGGTYPSVIGAVTQVVFNPAGAAGLGAVTIGHAAVQSVYSSTQLVAFGAPLNSWLAEPAAVRFGRLCGEEGIQFRCRGNPAATVAMGAQTTETLTQLLQECADADRGIWTELRQALGWGYVTRAALYNQPALVTLSYDEDHLSVHASDPTEDDQTTLNDVTLSSQDGSSVRYYAAPGQPVTGGRLSSLPPGTGGMGTYDNTPTGTVNLAWDKDLDNICNWMLHMGTIDEPRYPGLVLDLEQAALASLYSAIVQMDLGDRMVINGPPAWLPPNAISALWQGVQENIGDFEFQITVNGVPESPYEVAQAGAAHAATAGSQLAAGASASATTLSVETTAGNIWTVNAADLPFEIVVGGEVMTVTDITGSSSPQAFTVTRSVNGVVVAQSAGAAVQVYPLPAAAL